MSPFEIFSGRNFFTTSAILFSATLLAPMASATTFNGDLFYTKFQGGTGVYKVLYSYDDVAHTFNLAPSVAIAPLNGSDGIIFAPDGDLLVGGQAPVAYKLHSDGTNILSQPTNSGGAFHLTLDPTGTKFYTSNFGGPLSVVPLAPFGPGVAHTINGDDNGVTGIAFAANNANVFYVNGQPNANGRVGKIDLNTFTTQFLFSALSAHGMVYDSFTNLFTLFGAGAVGSFDDTGANFKQLTNASGSCDYDQGAVDGKGHALIAGCNGISFIDYSVSHDITSASNFTAFIQRADFTFIDDVAPLSGPGSNPNVPEPSGLGLLGVALAGLFGVRRRSSARN